MALRGVGFAVDCPFGCLGCRVSLEMSGYGAVRIKMGGFEVREGSEKLWMIIDDHSISPHRFQCHTSDKVHEQSYMSKIQFPEVHWGKGDCES